MEATTKTIVRASTLCTTCPKLCRFSCPVAVADGRESSTPTAKMTDAHRLAQGNLDMTPENVDPLYRCTGCGLQQEFCKHEVDAADALEAARGLAYEKGVLPEPLAAKEHRLRTDRDPLASELLRIAEGLRPAPRADASETLLVGCRMLKDDPGGARRALELLERAAGTAVSAWYREPICCGYPLYALGDRKGATAQAKAFARAARDLPRLTACDPSCAFMLREVYPQLGVKLKPQILTLVELLAEKSSGMNLAAPQTQKAVYHDPCHLGRRLGIFEPPRQLLRLAGVSLVEAPWSRKLARCCGFGAAYPLLDPAGARTIATSRREELRATGADIVATACPSCKMALSDPDGPQVRDVTDLLADAAGITAEE